MSNPNPELLSDDALREIEVRVSNLSAGTWLNNAGVTIDRAEDGETVVLVDDLADEADIEFIAHAREDIPALCATVRALRDENSDLRESVEQWVAHYNEVDKWRSELSISNTALREQLAQIEQCDKCDLCEDHHG